MTHWKVPTWLPYVLGGIVALTAVIALWLIPQSSPQETDRLLAATNVILVAALVATTVYYALLTRELVEETRLAREEATTLMHEERRLTAERHLARVISSLTGAANDVVGIGTKFAVLLQHRRVWRTRAIEPLLAPVVAASKALDDLRLIGEHSATSAGEHLFDEIIEFFGLATSGAGEGRLREQAESIAAAKQSLQSEADLGPSVTSPSSDRLDLTD